MTISRIALLVGALALACVASFDAASARHRHHRRHVDRTPRHFVFRTPEAAATASGIGEFAGETLSGMIGATTADPYQRPSYGYYVGGGRGPGYLYEDQ